MANEEKADIKEEKDKNTAISYEEIEKLIGKVEGDIEKEKILEKLLEDIEEEEKRRHIPVPRVRKEKEEEYAHIGPIVPQISLKLKEHTHKRPIIPPQNQCCTKLCKDLNDDISDRESSLGATIATSVSRGKLRYKTFPSLPYGLEALKDFRSVLKDKGVCTCYEETKDIESPLPIITGTPPRLVSAKTGEHITLSKNLPKHEPYLSDMRVIHTKDKSISPTHNHCCTTVCNVLTKEIDRLNNNLEQMEFGGKEFMKRSMHIPRYQAMAYRTFTLEEYRSKIAKKAICDCIK